MDLATREVMIQAVEGENLENHDQSFITLVIRLKIRAQGGSGKT